MRYYCTYFDRQYLIRGLALLQSLRKHESTDFTLIVVCMDELTRTILARMALPELRLIPLHEIDRQDETLLFAKRARSLVEYYWTMTPTIILRILERDRSINVLTYLDADLFFFSGPQPIFDELGQQSILIHEHRFSVRQASLAKHNGRFNVGLLSFRRDSHGLEALRWWRERCLEWCFARYEEGKMGDQLYLEDWPSRFTGVRVLQHPGGGVGPWNHDRYEIACLPDGAVSVDRLRLIFYHFHSLKLFSPELALPVAHAHYPLTRAGLQHCFVPYMQALAESYRMISQVMPQARWGFDESTTITTATTFMAHRSLRERCVDLVKGHRLIPLTDMWDVYGSDQITDENGRQGEVTSLSSRASANPIPSIGSCKPFKNEPPMAAVPSQHDLLSSLRGSDVAQQIQTLYIGGAHRFQERALLDELFPNLKRIYLFEPIPALADYLRRFESLDSRVRVFPLALSSENGMREFFLTNNDGESSSLLRLGKHKEIFPHVREVQSIQVPTRQLDHIILAEQLDEPDMLLLDVQGAEFQILSSLSSALKQRLLVLYVEASLEEVYQGGKCLGDLKTVLSSDLDLISFAPLGQDSPTHGNALFLNRRAVTPHSSRATAQADSKTPLVSVIVSSYAAEAFMRECLSDLERQTIVDKMEIIVVDAASPEAEGIIALEFQKRYRNISYLRSPVRIGVYAAWNLALRIARGRYVTPFSTNDRLRPDAYEILMRTLDQNTDVALVYGDTYLTDIPHQTYERHKRIGTWQWPDYDYRYLLSHCCVGPHPMWRRELHQSIGFFDESYIALGDQDFFIRVGAKHRLMHIPVVTGLYWKSPEGLSNQRAIVVPEERQLRSTYQVINRESVPLAQSVPQPTFDCSVIIPVWNRCELTRDCLQSLSMTTEGLSWELIVVDNHSTDETANYLASLGGDVQVIRNQENLGFAKACNQGAAAARGKYLVFLNNDTIPQDNWLRELVREVMEHPEVGIVGSKLLYADGTVQHAGVTFLRSQRFPYHIYRQAQADLPCVNKRREFQAVTGACLLIRRALFDDVRGFDEGFRNGFEDVDLCLKVRERGSQVIYQPRSLLFHLESQTPGRKLHEESNAKLLVERWGNYWWLADEDLHYHTDGYKLIGSTATGDYVGQVQALADIKDGAAWAHVAAAQAAAIKKDWAGVRLELALVQDWPRDPFVLSWAAMVSGKLEETALQRSFLARYLELTDAPDERLALIRMLLAEKDLPGADQHLNKLLASAPNHAEGLLLRGVLCMQREQYRDAEGAFSSALRQSADRKKCLMGMGMASMGQAYTQGAWERFLQVLGEHPDDAEAIHWLIRAGTAQNRWDQLSRHLREYLLRNPGDLSARFALASVLVRADRIEAARREYDALHALSPKYDGLAELGQAIANKETLVAMEAAQT